MCWGSRAFAARSFVSRSRATTVIITPQKSAELRLGLSILFPLLAFDAVPGVRKSIQALEGDFLAAVVALPELLVRAVQAAQCLIYVPKETAFLTCEQERLFALHRVGALVSHVEGVGAQIAVRALWRRPKRL